MRKNFLKKKGKIFIFFCLLIIAGVSVYFVTRDKTEIRVSSMSAEQPAAHSAYCDGNYYYYDYAQGGIIRENDGKTKLLIETAAPVRIAANKEYIYLLFENVLFQYDANGKLVADREVFSWTGMYVSEKYVYGARGTSIMILSAQDITKMLEDEATEVTFDISCKCSNTDGTGTVQYACKDMGTEFLLFRRYTDGELKEKEKGTVRFRDGMVLSKGTGNLLLYNNETDAVYYDEGMVIEQKVEHGTLEGFAKMEDGKITDLAETGDKYVMADDRTMAYVDGDVLYMAGSVFHINKIPFFSSPRGEADGPMCEHEREELLCVNIRSGEVIRSTSLKKGNKIVYADRERYIVYHKNALEFYCMEDGSLEKTVKLEHVEKNGKYTVELCRDKLFFYHKDELRECVNVGHQ